jgi:hypothetical protein
MRKCRNACPQLETMESLTLLSGVAASALVLPTPAEIANTTATSPLRGTLRGTFLVHQLGTEILYDYDLEAAGKLTPIGAATITGILHEFPGTNDEGWNGSMDLTTSRGTLTLQMPNPSMLPQWTAPAGSHETNVTYYISDGTGAYQNDTGIGVAEFKFTGGNLVEGSGAGEVAIKFTALPKTLKKT